MNKQLEKDLDPPAEIVLGTLNTTETSVELPGLDTVTHSRRLRAPWWIVLAIVAPTVPTGAIVDLITILRKA